MSELDSKYFVFLYHTPQPHADESLPSRTVTFLRPTNALRPDQLYVPDAPSKVYLYSGLYESLPPRMPYSPDRFTIGTLGLDAI